MNLSFIFVYLEIFYYLCSRKLTLGVCAMRKGEGADILMAFTNACFDHLKRRKFQIVVNQSKSQ